MIPVYVIHLPDENRKAHISAELAKAGFDNVTYVHAREPFDGFTCNNMRRNPRGEFGCALSHIKAINIALSDNIKPYALFVEDDIEFIRDIPALEDFPPYWDIVYLGGHPRGPMERDKYRPQFCNVMAGFSCAEAYMMHECAMRAFLRFWCDRAGQKDAMFDIILGEFAASVMGYALYPVVTRQPAGWSHIGQKVDDKSHLIEKGWRENLVA